MKHYTRLWGQEQIIVSDDTLTLTTSLPRVVQEYPISEISHLRLNLPLPADPAGTYRGRPAIVFEYRGKSRTCAGRLDGFEAVYILHRIEQHYPGLVRIGEQGSPLGT